MVDLKKLNLVFLIREKKQTERWEGLFSPVIKIHTHKLPILIRKQLR